MGESSSVETSIGETGLPFWVGRKGWVRMFGSQEKLVSILQLVVYNQKRMSPYFSTSSQKFYSCQKNGVSELY